MRLSIQVRMVADVLMLALELETLGVDRYARPIGDNLLQLMQCCFRPDVHHDVRACSSECGDQSCRGTG